MVASRKASLLYILQKQTICATPWTIRLELPLAVSHLVSTIEFFYAQLQHSMKDLVVSVSPWHGS